jgi:molybdopterin-guanine dinucleotide biosynthesis protein A
MNVTGAIRPAVPFAVLLLAGGRSSRMGSPKALLDWAGAPLWRHQADTLDQLHPDERFISLPPGRALEAPMGWTAVRDRDADLGPLGGIEAALRVMGSDRLVVLAIDLPAMTPDFLRRCLADSASGRGVVPAIADWYQGLAAVYPRAVHPIVEAALAGADRSVQQVAARAVASGLLTVRPVSDVERPQFRNLNRPGD